MFYVVPVKSTVEISQNFVAFSEYKNFMYNMDFELKKGINSIIALIWWKKSTFKVEYLCILQRNKENALFSRRTREYVHNFSQWNCNIEYVYWRQTSFNVKLRCSSCKNLNHFNYISTYARNLVPKHFVSTIYFHELFDQFNFYNFVNNNIIWCTEFDLRKEI